MSDKSPDYPTPEFSQNETGPNRPLTRMEKVVDFLLLAYCNLVESIGALPHATMGGAISSKLESIVSLLILTEPYYYLQNRRRLLELVEKAMPEEAAK